MEWVSILAGAVRSCCWAEMPGMEWKWWKMTWGVVFFRNAFGMMRWPQKPEWDFFTCITRLSAFWSQSNCYLLQIHFAKVINRFILFGCPGWFWCFCFSSLVVVNRLVTLVLTFLGNPYEHDLVWSGSTILGPIGFARFFFKIPGAFL